MRTCQSWLLTVDDPPRWWPRSLGAQPLCTVTLTVDVAGAPSDTRTVRTAFREIRCDNWVFSVNGERLFLKGTNLAPTRMALGAATTETIRHDLELAQQANLDFVRVHAHVARPELYDAADELGLLVWQDLPLQWGYARGIRKQAGRQARAMVDQLGHHPSVFLWCAHNAPVRRRPRAGRSRWTRGARVKLVATTVLPTWSKQVLDRSVARAIARHDGTRPVSRHSGVFPGFAEGGTDTHQYHGWYHGDARRPRRGVAPLAARAVASCRSSARRPCPIPTTGWSPIAGPISTGTRSRAITCCKPTSSQRGCHQPRPSRSTNGARCTQAYQAALLQLQIEDLRRVKYAPTGGFAQFSLRGSAPGRQLVGARPRARPRSAATARSATRAGRCSR